MVLDSQTLFLIVALVLIGGLILALLYFWLGAKLAATSPTKWFERPLKETNKQQRREEFYQKAYVFMLRVPFLRRLVRTIRRRLETSASTNEFVLRKMIVSVIFRVFIICVAIFTIFLMINPSFILFLWLVIGLTMLGGTLVDTFIYKVELRLLQQLKEYLDHIRFSYQQTKMIDESVYESMQRSGPEMKIQAQRMHNILTSVDMYKELTEYENIAPNRFFKTVASLQVYVSDKGDVANERGSAFLRGLTSLLQEINDEILYRKKLHYSLRSLGVLAVIPMFFVIPTENWAVNYFPTLNMFYDSWIGYMAKILVYLSTFVAYLVVRKLKEISESNYQTKVDKTIWEDKLLKFKPFALLIRTMTPAEYQKKFYQLNELIKAANEKIAVKHLYVRRVLLSVVLFVITVIGSFYIHYEQKQNVLYNVSTDTMLTGNLSEKDLEKYEQLTANDRRILLELNTVKGSMSDTMLRDLVITHFGYNPSDPAIDEAVDRINEKWDTFINAYFKWWELVGAFIIAFVGFWLPVGYLQLLKNIRKQEMENEVSQFYVLIGILREFDSMTAEQILLWMERFSVTFKDVLRVGIQNFDAGPVEAIEWMKSEATFVPFTQILTRLETSVTKVSLQEAFDDADIEREFYLLQRRDNNEKTIAERSQMGNMIGLLPAYILVFGYLTVPFLWVSMVSMTDLISQIQ